MTLARDLVALDIGGANLKAADGLGWTASSLFPLWKRWQELPEALAALVADRRPSRLVATMTGEICDCYPSRAAGVAHIVESLIAASHAVGCKDPPGVYLLDGRVVGPLEAVREWGLASASNWHAVATVAGDIVKDTRAFLVDIGSTTTDIIPIENRSPAPLAHDDAGRMLSGELVYTGIARTAVAAIVRRLPHRGVWRPVASELFAESRDAWLTLEGIPEDATARDTADNGPATRDAARVRLARTMLLDPETFSDEDAATAAEWIANRQASQIARAARRVARAVGWLPEAIVLSGHGEALASRALAAAGWNLPIVRLADSLGPAVARVAPAYALALIASGAIP
jgi:probable H4MPT-linked C1 transfer pathway protein